MYNFKIVLYKLNLVKKNLL